MSASWKLLRQSRGRFGRRQQPSLLALDFPARDPVGEQHGSDLVWSAPSRRASNGAQKDRAPAIEGAARPHRSFAEFARAHVQRSEARIAVTELRIDPPGWPQQAAFFGEAAVKRGTRHRRQRVEIGNAHILVAGKLRSAIEGSRRVGVVAEAERALDHNAAGMKGLDNFANS